MRVSLIAAVADNGVIGKDNDLVWSLPDDMSFFKASTQGRHVIMGRRNYESIPHKFRPLPGRPNVVMSRNADYDAGGAALVGSLTEALDLGLQPSVGLEKSTYSRGSALDLSANGPGCSPTMAARHLVPMGLP